jgi:hypothetical protein
MDQLLLACDIEPTSYEEALKHECWRLAMLDEMTSIEASGTWKLTNLPIGACAIGLKWVFKVKKDAARIVTKHKEHLITKEYEQRQGIDFSMRFLLRLLVLNPLGYCLPLLRLRSGQYTTWSSRLPS